MPDLTFKQLQHAAATLAKEIARGAEAIRQEAKAVDEDAKATARDADSIGALCVDKATIAETRELSKTMAGLSDGVIAYASAADTTAKQAKAVHDQNDASHARYNETVNRSSVGREIYDVKRKWFLPE